jgi:hypothetical protein
MAASLHAHPAGCAGLHANRCEEHGLLLLVNRPTALGAIFFVGISTKMITM